MKVLTITEAAEILPLSKWTLYKLAESGETPFRKLGGKWMATEDDLIAWVRNGDTRPRKNTTGAKVSGRMAIVNHYRELRNGERSQN